MHTTQSNVVGNVYDKYGTQNPVARWLMQGFLDAVGGFYRRCRAESVLEVGCGEGHLAQQLVSLAQPTRFVATDLSLERVAAPDPRVEFLQASIYELPFDADSFDLVVCCEVLEHLHEPARGLSEVARVARSHVIVSTPREPLWRAMNLARGRYVRDLGNTPGHVQHFSQRGLRELAETQLRVSELAAPVPWTVILGSPR